MTRKKDPAAVALGSRGGRARWAKMSAEERSEYASQIASMPRSKASRCNCGEMTAKRAIARGHKC